MTSEPFRPVTRAGADREIDAADPGYGAPGSDTTPDDDSEAQRRFDAHMAEVSQKDAVFRTPDPRTLHEPPADAP